MKQLLRTTFALALLLALGCDPGTIPNRNVNDVSHETRVLNAANHQLVVHNPNNVRVGTEFRIRVFQDGVRPPIRESVEHVYVPAMMDGTLEVDLSDLCDPDAEPPGTEFFPTTGSGDGSGAERVPNCDELRIHAVLLQTYWLADE